MDKRILFQNFGRKDKRKNVLTIKWIVVKLRVLGRDDAFLIPKVTDSKFQPLIKMDCVVSFFSNEDFSAFSFSQIYIGFLCGVAE